MTTTREQQQDQSGDGSFVRGALMALLSLTLLTVAMGGLYAQGDDAPRAAIATTTR